jgi:hypothetical protein
LKPAEVEAALVCGVTKGVGDGAVGAGGESAGEDNFTCEVLAALLLETLGSVLSQAARMLSNWSPGAPACL